MCNFVSSVLIIIFSSILTLSQTCFAAEPPIKNDKETSVGNHEPEISIVKKQVEERILKIVENSQRTPVSKEKADSQRGEIIFSDSNSGDSAETTITVTPVYLPPIRGAPVGRVAGGTRGILDEYPSLLCVISPDHTALTLLNQPQLHWFLREATTYPIELTVIEDQAIHPLLETQIHQPTKPGIQKIRMVDYEVSLRQGVTYKWFIAVVPDLDRRSKDILAWGAIRYVKISGNLQEKLFQIDKNLALDIFAQAGIWYDAFACISDLIDLYPYDTILLEKRRMLLEQVGLSQILP